MFLDGNQEFPWDSRPPSGESTEERVIVMSLFSTCMHMMQSPMVECSQERLTRASTMLLELSTSKTVGWNT